MYVYIYKFLSEQWKVTPALQILFVLTGFYMVLTASLSTFRSYIHPDKNADFEQLESFVINNTRQNDVFCPCQILTFLLAGRPGGRYLLFINSIPAGERKYMNGITGFVNVKR